MKFQLRMSIVTNVMNFRRMMGKTGLRLSNKKFTHKCILSSYSLLTHRFSCGRGHNFTYFWHIGLKLCTHLDKVVVIMSQNITLIYIASFVKYCIFLHHTFFWDTRYVCYLQLVVVSDFVIFSLICILWHLIIAILSTKMNILILILHLANLLSILLQFYF